MHVEQARHFFLLLVKHKIVLKLLCEEFFHFDNEEKWTQKTLVRKMPIFFLRLFVSKRICRSACAHLHTCSIESTHDFK